jgi:hypothetical protein
MDAVSIIESIELAEALAGVLAGTTLVSETLPFVKKIKANSTFQLCFDVLKAVLGVFVKKKES